MKLEDQAELIARIAHAGQKRRGGADYITHPKRVAHKLRDQSEAVRATAWLHDVLEDTPVTAELLTGSIPPEVVHAVEVLTHRTGESYDQYLMRLKMTGNEIALAVKIADIEDNLADIPTDRQKEKYRAALQFLKQ